MQAFTTGRSGAGSLRCVTCGEGLAGPQAGDDGAGGKREGVGGSLSGDTYSGGEVLGG